MKQQLRPNIALLTFEIDAATYHCLPIKEWADYFVSTSGYVISTKGDSPIVLADRIINGYCYAILSEGARKQQSRVHRLVAHAFLRSPLADRQGHDRDQVNHLDCNTRNNKVANLEWCSSPENLSHYRVMKAIAQEAAND
jgi:hypothetical protein